MVAAINANATGEREARGATTYRSNAGAGVVLPRAKTELSDFLDTATNAHVQRGPFRYSVLRIGKKRDGSQAWASSCTASSTPASGRRR